MSGEVKKYVSTSHHGGMVAVVSNDYSNAYVEYDDYAELQTAFDRCHAESVERWRALIDAGRALEALQAKLDAVTRDARWLLDLIDENEGRTAYSLRAQHTMADIECRLTDQGRAGEVDRG